MAPGPSPFGSSLVLASLCNRRTPANSDRTRSLPIEPLALTRHTNILITPLRGDPHLIRTPDYRCPHPLHHPCVLALRGSLFGRVGYPRGWVTFPGASLTGRPSCLGNILTRSPQVSVCFPPCAGARGTPVATYLTQRTIHRRPRLTLTYSLVRDQTLTPLQLC